MRLRRGFVNLEKAPFGGEKLRIPSLLFVEKMRTQSRFNVREYHYACCKTLVCIKSLNGIGCSVCLSAVDARRGRKQWFLWSSSAYEGEEALAQCVVESGGGGGENAPSFAGRAPAFARGFRRGV